MIIVQSMSLSDEMNSKIKRWQRFGNISGITH